MGELARERRREIRSLINMKKNCFSSKWRKDMTILIRSFRTYVISVRPLYTVLERTRGKMRASIGFCLKRVELDLAPSIAKTCKSGLKAKL